MAAKRKAKSKSESKRNVVKIKIDHCSLGMACHTALRKCCDTTPTTLAYLLINAMGIAWPAVCWWAARDIMTKSGGRKVESMVHLREMVRNCFLEATGNYSPVVTGRFDLSGDTRGQMPEDLPEEYRRIPETERELARCLGVAMELFTLEEWGGFCSYIEDLADRRRCPEKSDGGDRLHRSHRPLGRKAEADILVTRAPVDVEIVYREQAKQPHPPGRIRIRVGNAALTPTEILLTGLSRDKEKMDYWLKQWGIEKFDFAVLRAAVRSAIDHAFPLGEHQKIAELSKRDKEASRKRQPAKRREELRVELKSSAAWRKRKIAGRRAVDEASDR
jgi:hypothetical protein